MNQSTTQGVEQRRNADQSVSGRAATRSEITVAAFETEGDLALWVEKEWKAGVARSKGFLRRHGKKLPSTTEWSTAFLAGFEAHQLMAAAQEVPGGFTLGTQQRQYADLYRSLHAEALIDESNKASMKPLLQEYESEELSAAMAVITQYGDFTDSGEFVPMLVRPLDADARPLAYHRDISIDEARSIVAKRYIELSADRDTTTRIDMRFDLEPDLLAPQIVFVAVPRTTKAWLERGETHWAYWYLPEIWEGKDGRQMSSWYHAGDWVESPVADWDPDSDQPGKPVSRFVPGVLGSVATFTSPAASMNAAKHLLRAVLRVRKISAELAAQSEFEHDPVRDVSFGADAGPLRRTRQEPVL